jgi:hypothetical protein
VFDPSKIPGMIEPVEQQLLTGLAADRFVAENGAIVEFGSFFGRSTACLVNGALTWWSPERAPTVYTFDSFACSGSRGGFAQYVKGFAHRAGVGHIVRIEGDRVDFRPVYDHFVGKAEAAGVLKTTATELSKAQRPDVPIALMHIDAPKFYAELKYILVRFFPALVPGARIVFQDYFYQWSAGLVAGVQLLADCGIVHFERSAASALLSHVLRVPSVDEIAEIDLAMADAKVPDLIDRSIAAMKGVEIDRAEQFLPRLHLAKMQYLWEQQQFTAAEAAFLRMMSENGNALSGPVFTDFRELLRYGFSIRRLYEIDRVGDPAMPSS